MDTKLAKLFGLKLPSRPCPLRLTGSELARARWEFNTRKDQMFSQWILFFSNRFRNQVEADADAQAAREASGAAEEDEALQLVGKAAKIAATGATKQFAYQMAHKAAQVVVCWLLLATESGYAKEIVYQHDVDLRFSGHFLREFLLRINISDRVLRIFQLMPATEEDLDYLNCDRSSVVVFEQIVLGELVNATVNTIIAFGRMLYALYADGTTITRRHVGGAAKQSILRYYGGAFARGLGGALAWAITGRGGAVIVASAAAAPLWAEAYVSTRVPSQSRALLH
eukprot:Hpha_TRINITY_DN13897_c0_g1::TRINITY_DN13897_c0_g1_i1::g.69688::m.69688